MRIIITIALVAIFWGSPAYAGTNTWTQTNTTASLSGCGPASGVSALRGCMTGYMGSIGTGGGDCGLEMDTPTIGGTSPNLTVAITAHSTGTMNSFGNSCTATMFSTWSFTDACASLGDGYYFEDGDDGMGWPVGGCAAPIADCSGVNGEEREAFYSSDDIISGGCAAQPGGEVAECAVSATGFTSCIDGECFGRFVYTGSACDSETEGELEFLGTSSPSAGTDCISGGGATVCSSSNAKNCGTFNGEAICVEGVPDGDCTFLGNGGMVCAGAGAPPAPSTEDGMAPALPSAEFQAMADGGSGGRNFQYFSPGTVAGSGTPTTGSGGGGADGIDDPEDPTEEPGECEEPGACVIELPDIPDADVPGDAAAAIGSATAGIASGPLAGLTASFGEGECPTAEFDLFGETYVVDAQCTLIEEQRAAIAAIFLLVWALFGVRILMET